MKSLKQLAWFIFKSPQRKWVGWGSLFTDIKGIFSLWFGKPIEEKIWVCTGNYNRSEMLLTRLLPSLSAASSNHNIALSVADCGSQDIDNLEQRIREVWKGELIFSSIAEPFARAKCFNRAIQQAPGELIFVCDTDMSVPLDIEKHIKRSVRNYTAWFPICQWQIEEGRPDWKWFGASTGMFAATKSQLKQTGYYDENYTTWGKEDWDLFFRFYKAGIMPYRKKTPGLYHHWHTSLMPEGYENMF